MTSHPLFNHLCFRRSAPRDVRWLTGGLRKADHRSRGDNSRSHACSLNGYFEWIAVGSCFLKPWHLFFWFIIQDLWTPHPFSGFNIRGYSQDGAFSSVWVWHFWYDSVADLSSRTTSMCRTDSKTSVWVIYVPTQTCKYRARGFKNTRIPL